MCHHCRRRQNCSDLVNVRLKKLQRASELHYSKKHTRVGAFVFQIGLEGNDPEIANRISRGGFSDIFRLFEFQAPATTAFLGSIGNQYSGFYKCVYSCRLTQPTKGVAGPESRTAGRGGGGGIRNPEKKL